MKSIAVYCGSSSGKLPDYANAARALGRALVDRNLKLIYGGAAIGMMGILADTVLERGGEVVGVMPEALVRKEVAHKNLTALHVTQSMHERKMLMADLADGFIALPGGVGTLDEIFEIWTWAQLGIHHKPCGLLNAAGYYDKLTGFLQHAISQGFIKSPSFDMLMVEQYPDTLLDRFARYEAPTIDLVDLKVGKA